MLKKYDTDGSGNLDANELTQLLAHHDNGIKRDWDEYKTGIVLKNVGTVAPTSEEVSWLLKSRKKNMDSCVHVSEIGFILDLWHSYVMNREKLTEAFEKFDIDHNNQLEFDQLKNYLTELNQGQTPKVVLLQHPILATRLSSPTTCSLSAGTRRHTIRALLIFGIYVIF